ncbi:MAG: cysteine desulfurase [Clostridia bacterium]|jgi:cysteine desulfurase|nr:cysteine desulfurase [Clostridia bacterium]
MGIYLDHSATTYVDKKVLAKMTQCYSETFGNTSSQHSYGRDAEKGVGAARAQVADAIGASPGEIYFTSGGTESDNWAIKGVAKFARKGHIITTGIEHRAVLDTCKYLEAKGFSITYLPVDAFGAVRADDVEKALQDDTILISIMFANNEVGTINPMAQIGQIAKKHGVLFHTDAVQAVGHVPIDVSAIGIDLLSLSAHKFYGPKGVGALYIKNGTNIEKIIHGGSHEKGMRAGTLNSPGIVGLGAAISLATEVMDNEFVKEAALAKRLKDALLQLPKAKYNGHPDDRLPGNVNISFDGIEAEALMLHLDLEGIAVSTGSACSSGSTNPSYVLKEMGCTIEQARAAVRFTIGRCNTTKDIDTAAKKTKSIVEKLRALSPLFADKGEKNV